MEDAFVISGVFIGEVLGSAAGPFGTLADDAAGGRGSLSIRDGEWDPLWAYVHDSETASLIRTLSDRLPLSGGSVTKRCNRAVE